MMYAVMKSKIMIGKIKDGIERQDRAKIKNEMQRQGGAKEDSMMILEVFNAPKVDHIREVQKRQEEGRKEDNEDLICSAT